MFDILEEALAASAEEQGDAVFAEEERRGRGLCPSPGGRSVPAPERGRSAGRHAGIARLEPDLATLSRRNDDGIHACGLEMLAVNPRDAERAVAYRYARWTMKKYLALTLLLSCGLASAQVTYQQIGDTTFASDGRTFTRIGDTTFGSDGSTSQRIGDTTFRSDGSTVQRIGDTAFDSDGTTYQRIGDTTFGSNGVVCQRIGETLFCN